MLVHKYKFDCESQSKKPTDWRSFFIRNNNCQAGNQLPHKGVLYELHELNVFPGLALCLLGHIGAKDWW